MIFEKPCIPKKSIKKRKITRCRFSFSKKTYIANKQKEVQSIYINRYKLRLYSKYNKDLVLSLC